MGKFAKNNIRKKVATIVTSAFIISNIFSPSSVRALGEFGLNSSVISKPVNSYSINLSPGIEEKRYTYENNLGKRVEGFVVEVDTKNSNISIEAGTPNDGISYGFQTVRDQANTVIANGEQIVAGVNSDFYNTANGVPIGVVIKDGIIIKDECGGWKFFGILKDGTPVIGDSAKYNEVKDNLEEALGGNAILVKDGKVFETPQTGADREPRTAVGIKKDGKVFFIAVDGRQEPYSAGISMGELAELMISMGAVQALNLDGGGSSTYISRTAGTDTLELKNRPSDGQERRVANSWLVVSKATIDHRFASAFIEPFDKSFTPGAAINFVAKGRDIAGASAQLPTSGLAWTLSDTSFGTIDANTGKFISDGKEGQVEVLLNYNGQIVGKTYLEIATPDEIYFSSNTLTVAKNDAKPLGLVTRFNERDVLCNPDDIIWDIPQGMGTIDEKGILHTGDKSMSGTIKATLKGTSLTASIEVTVGRLPEIICDFENGLGSWKVTTVNRGEVGSIDLSTYPKEPVRFGNNSLKINYDFTNGQKQTTLGVYAGPGENELIPGKPSTMGMWVYATSEAKGYWLRMGLIDGNNKAQYINLTNEVPGVDWVGWKYVEAQIPSTFVTPLYLHPTQTIRLMSTKSGITGPMTKGTLYVDNIRSVYGDKIDDLYAPIIEEINVQGKSYTTNKITITAKLHDYEQDPFATGINWDRVRVIVDGTDYTGKEGHFSYDKDGIVSLSGYTWADGTHKVDIIAQDNFGNETIKTAYFTVNTGASKVEVVKTEDLVLLGGTYKLNISTNNPSSVKTITARIKVSKDFPITNVQFNSSAKDSAYEYDKENGILTLNIKNSSTINTQVNLATINISAPNTIKEGTELTYEVVDSKVQYANTTDDSFISSFSVVPTAIKVEQAYKVIVESTMIGKDGVIRILGRDSKPVLDTNVYMELADGKTILLGKTDKKGYVISKDLTDTVKKYNIYAEKNGLYSFRAATQSYTPLEDGKPSNILLGTNVDPTKEQSVSWMSNPLLSQTKALVQYAEKSKYEKVRDAAWKTVKGEYKDQIFNGNQDPSQNGIVRLNTATIKGLHPGITYIYKVGDGKFWSSIDEFTTQSQKDNFNFLILGDTQSATIEGLTDLDKIISKVEGEKERPDFTVHMGDFIDDASMFNQWDSILSTLHKHELFNSIDMVNVLGNHEYMGDTSGDIAERIFNTPRNGLKENLGGVYSANYNNVHISVISFTSDKSLLEKELQWLREDIKKSNKQWNVLITHQPPYYTNPLGGSNMVREMLPPVVDELGIDLVLSGHDHAYGRTKMLKGGVESQEGTIYVVTGTTGQKHYDAVNDGSFAAYNGDKDPMYLTVSVNKENVKIIAKKIDGTIVDEFTIKK